MMARSIICAVAGRPGGAPYPRSALRRSLLLPGVAVLAAGFRALPCLAAASKPDSETQPEGINSDAKGLDAARKRLLECPPTTSDELKWRKVVQELRENEQWWLERCLKHEKEGELVSLADAYSSWKRYREELALYERDPRLWLRKHGQHRGLRMHMSPKDKAKDFLEEVGPLFVCIMSTALAFACLSNIGH